MENPFKLKTPTEFYATYSKKYKELDKVLPTMDGDLQPYETNITIHNPEEIDLFGKFKEISVKLFLFSN